MSTPIKERIRRAYLGARKVGHDWGDETARDYREVIYATFPESDYPRAWRHSSNGGPPGCAMAFSRAVREMGGRMDWDPRTVWLPAAALRGE